jgi:hypothetical protein
MLRLKNLIFLAVAVFVLHAYLMLENWYQYFKNLDNFMHGFGGLVAGLFGLLLFCSFLQVQLVRYRFLLIILFTLAFVAFIGVLWEFFEFGLDFFIKRTGYFTLFQTRPDGVTSFDIYQDTLGDLFFDILGGLVAVFIFLLKRNRDFGFVDRK